jgi:hypothetical protein
MLLTLKLQEIKIFSLISVKHNHITQSRCLCDGCPSNHLQRWTPFIASRREIRVRRHGGQLQLSLSERDTIRDSAACWRHDFNLDIPNTDHWCDWAVNRHRPSIKIVCALCPFSTYLWCSREYLIEPQQREAYTLKIYWIIPAHVWCMLMVQCRMKR